MKSLLTWQFYTAVLTILFIIKSTKACKPEWFGYDKHIDCIEYFKTQEEKCDDEVMIRRGEQQSEDMTAGLYKGVASDETVNQVNFLLFPREIARVISALIEATGKAATETQEGTLNQIRCHIDTLTTKMMNTIEVPNDDGKNFGGAETKFNVTKGKEPVKMLSHIRKVFLDENLKPAENYSKESYCWYHIPITNTLSFNDGNATIKTINEWADKSSVEAVKQVNPTHEDKKIHRQALAADPEAIKNDRALIASSIYLQIRWPNNLFERKNTLLDQEFVLEKSAKKSTTKLKVQLMKAFGDFKLIQTETYTAISLPTEENGSFIVALPNDNNNLASVEAEIIKNGQSIDAFVEAVNSAEKTKEYTVLLPKLSIQIIHEWSTPSNKKLDVFSNDTGYGIKGDQVAVYQDTYLDLSENKAPETEAQCKNETLAVLEPIKTIDENKLMKINRPFVFVFVIKTHVVALGRIKDPSWCKNCIRTIVDNPETNKHETEEEKSDYSEHFKYYAALINKTSSTTENPVSAKKELKELKKLVSSVDPASIAENVTLITHKEGDIEHPLKPEEEHTVTETVDASNSSNNILKMMFKS